MGPPGPHVSYSIIANYLGKVSFTIEAPTTLLNSHILYIIKFYHV